MKTDYDTLPGQVRLEERDIIQMNGAPGIVISCNESCARVQPMVENVVKIRTRFDKETEFVRPGQPISISACMDRSLVIGRATEQQWEKYCKKKPAEVKTQSPEPQTVPPAEQEQTTNGGAQTETKQMSKKQATKGSKKKAAASKTNGTGRDSARKDFIWSLLDGAHTKEEITDQTVKKFGGDRATILKRVNDAPFYMRKAGLKPAWKEKEKASATA